MLAPHPFPLYRPQPKRQSVRTLPERSEQVRPHTFLFRFRTFFICTELSGSTPGV